MLSEGAASKMCIRDSTKTLCMLFFSIMFQQMLTEIMPTFFYKLFHISQVIPAYKQLRPLVTFSLNRLLCRPLQLSKCLEQLHLNFIGKLAAVTEVEKKQPYYILDDFIKIIYDTLGFCDSSKMFPLRFVTRYTGIITTSSGLIKSIFSV